MSKACSAIVLTLGLCCTAATIVASFAPWVIFTVTLDGQTGTTKLSLWKSDDGSQSTSWGDLMNSPGFQFCLNKPDTEQPDSSRLLQHIHGAEAAVILTIFLAAAYTVASCMTICTSISWLRHLIPALALCSAVGATATLGLFLSVYYACGKSFCAAMGVFVNNPPPGVTTHFTCGVHYGLGMAVVAALAALAAAVLACCTLKRTGPSSAASEAVPDSDYTEFDAVSYKP